MRGASYFDISRNMETSAATHQLAALAHDGRLGAFRALIRAGEEGLAAGELAALSGAAPSTNSAQLAVLEQAGLIAGTREGRSIRYRVRFEAMRALMTFLLADCCNGRPEICAPVAQSLACLTPAAGDAKRC